MLLALIACQPADEASVEPSSLVVPLRWTAEPGGIGWEQVEAGLAWSLTNLGALPPPDGWITHIESHGYTISFKIDFAQAGFDPQAEAALRAAVKPLQASDEVAVLGSVDVGRLLMRTVYAPWRYYSITGACAELSSWESLAAAEAIEEYGVTLSLLTTDDRLITLNAGPWEDVSEIAFSTRSGAGVLQDPLVSEEVEVIDLMGNGQQRYAVFDAQGQLSPAADPAVILAGQPGKCMWCHEGALMTGSPTNPTTRPHLSYPEWITRMSQMQALQDAHRQTLESAADFTDRQAHTDGELLVREFLWPTPDRMQREWGVTADELAEILENNDVETTLDNEYPSRGPILSRVDLDSVYAAELAPPGYESLEILPDDREAPAAGVRDGVAAPLGGGGDADCGRCAGKAGGPVCAVRWCDADVTHCYVFDSRTTLLRPERAVDLDAGGGVCPLPLPCPRTDAVPALANPGEHAGALVLGRHCAFSTLGSRGGGGTGATRPVAAVPSGGPRAAAVAANEAP